MLWHRPASKRTLAEIFVGASHQSGMALVGKLSIRAKYYNAVLENSNKTVNVMNYKRQISST